MASPIEKKIDDWQEIVNKPVFTRDGRDVGVVESIQAERIIVSYGPVSRNTGKYAIPKSSVVDFDELRVIRLKEDSDFVEHHYKFA
jgi:sporulation protein YlmC with PRC-barrel domain